jgi:hypothetical protein
MHAALAARSSRSAIFKSPKLSTSLLRELGKTVKAEQSPGYYIHTFAAEKHKVAKYKEVMIRLSPTAQFIPFIMEANRRLGTEAQKQF